MSLVIFQPFGDASFSPFGQLFLQKACTWPAAVRAPVLQLDDVLEQRLSKSSLHVKSTRGFRLG